MPELELMDYGMVPLSRMTAELSVCAVGIPLHKRDGTIDAFAVVDREDYQRLSGFNYSFGSERRYARRRLPGSGDSGTCVPLHRDVLGLVPFDGVRVDHINQNKLDNRKANLRRCTHAENSQNINARPGSTSKYRGVSWDKSKQRWKATGTLNYRTYHLGRFKTEEEAADAAAAWRKEHMPFSTN